MTADSQPPALRDVRPTARQAVITLVGGIILAITTCAGFWATLNFNTETTAFELFTAGFLLSLVIVFAGAVMVIARVVMLSARRAEADAAARAAASRARAATESPGTAVMAPVVAPAESGVGATATSPRSASWKALVWSVSFGIAVIACFALLMSTDGRSDSVAIVFLVLGGIAILGCGLSFIVAVVLYLSGR